MPQTKVTQYFRPTYAQALSAAGRAVGKYAGEKIVEYRNKPKNKTPKVTKVIQTVRATTKRRAHDHEHSASHGELTYSNFSLTRKPKNTLEKKLASVKGKITRRYMDASRISGVSGRQRVQEFMFFETSHLQTMVQDVWNSQNVKDTGNAVDPVTNTPLTPSTVTVNDLSPYIHKTKHQLTLSNMENIPTFFTVYDLLCKRDTDEKPQTSWARGMQEQGEAGLLTTPPDIAFSVGTNPRMSKIFNEKWKIEKSKRVHLKPGENHKHNVYINPNMVVSNNRVQPSTETAKKYLAGVTRCVFIVAESNMVSSIADPAQVSTGPVALGAIWLRTYTYSANMKQHRVTYPSANNILIIGDPRGVQEDGDIAAVTQT